MWLWKVSSFDGCEIKYLCLSVCASHSIHKHLSSCCHVGHLTSNYRYFEEKSYFSVTFYPSVLFRCHVTIQKGSHISIPLLPESLFHLFCVDKSVYCAQFEVTSFNLTRSKTCVCFKGEVSLTGEEKDEKMKRVMCECMRLSRTAALQ